MVLICHTKPKPKPKYHNTKIYSQIPPKISIRFGNPIFDILCLAL